MTLDNFWNGLKFKECMWKGPSWFIDIPKLRKPLEVQINENWVQWRENVI